MSRKINRVGKQKRMNCGLMATIIGYRSCSDMDVRFETGDVVYGVQYVNFSRGGVSPKNYEILKNREQRVGQSKMMNCGEIGTIVAYRNNTDIDVSFPGYDKPTNTTYCVFRNGHVLPAGYKEKMRRLREGVTVTANNGQKMTCIAYYDANNIDIKFEDGTVVYDKQYRAFLSGSIKNPNAAKKIGKRKSFATEEYDYER